MRGALLALALTAPAAAQEHTLALRPARDNLPNVMAALDPAAAIDPRQRSLNPFLYECVAFLQLRGPDGAVAAFAAAPAVWVAPAGDFTKRRRPRLVALRAARRTLMVTLDPGDSRREFVVGLDSAAVGDSAAPGTVRALVSEPFTIPAGELEQCGRVPAVEIDLLAPDGEHAGFNVDLDAFWRRPIGLGGGGLVEIGLQGSATSAGESALLNTLRLGGRVELKVNKGFDHWVSVGVVEAFEATERFDVVDLALGAAVRVRLDMLPVRRLRRLLRRFTPYPMLAIEYHFVDRLEGGSASQHRVRGGLDWEVPMILGTTLRVRCHGDYLLSDVPSGAPRLRTVNDVSLSYPLGLADDVALVIQWLDGRAAPSYELASRWLLGLGLRR